MIVELGHFALVLALALSLVQSVVPFYGARTADTKLMAVADSVATFTFLAVAASFAAL